jgi:hypothetical protein
VLRSLQASGREFSRCRAGQRQASRNSARQSKSHIGLRRNLSLEIVLDFSPNRASDGRNGLWGDGSLASIMKTIIDGVPDPKDYRSPMPPKGGAQLSNSDVSAVAAYVWALGHQAAR